MYPLPQLNLSFDDLPSPHPLNPADTTLIVSHAAQPCGRQHNNRCRANGTNSACKTARTRFWSWLSVESPPSLSSCSLFARQLQGSKYLDAGFWKRPVSTCEGYSFDVGQHRAQLGPLAKERRTPSMLQRLQFQKQLRSRPNSWP